MPHSAVATVRPPEDVEFVSVDEKSFVIVLTFQAPSRSLSVSARNGIAGSSQIFSQFQFHLNRCFKRHRVQMFVKLWHQAHAIFPDDPSRFVAVFVILESVIDWDSCHADIDARLQGITFGIQP